MAGWRAALSPPPTAAFALDEVPDQHDREIFADGSVELSVPGGWHVTQVLYRRELRTTEMPDSFPSAIAGLVDGVCLACRVRSIRGSSSGFGFRRKTTY